MNYLQWIIQNELFMNYSKRIIQKEFIHKLFKKELFIFNLVNNELFNNSWISQLGSFK